MITAVREGLGALADPAKAPGMQAYMRSAMPFLGVPSLVRRELVRRVVAEHPPADVDELVAGVGELWAGARYREERYVAVEIAGQRRFAAWQTPRLLPLYRGWIVSGAWWDHVDPIASRLVGALLRRYPDQLPPVMREWATETDRWLRRTSVICQLSSKAATDTALLRYAIEANVGDPDFFLRKAIGWALRQHSRVDPGWVTAFVEAHPGLSPLSRREALKHL